MQKEFISFLNWRTRWFVHFKVFPSLTENIGFIEYLESRCRYYTLILNSTVKSKESYADMFDLLMYCLHWSEQKWHLKFQSNIWIFVSVSLLSRSILLNPENSSGIHFAFPFHLDIISFPHPFWLIIRWPHIPRLQHKSVITVSLKCFA